MKLLKKELRLALHPTAILFLALSAMLMIPSYPYHVVFFYTTLGVFFISMQGRENQDVDFTMLLPIRRRDLVQGRYALVVLLELCQLITAIPFCLLRSALPIPPNPVGLEANIALLGSALILYGVFHLVFFGVYYRNVARVGTAFLAGSAAVFLYIVIAEALPHAVPFIRDRLDTPDPQFLPEKLAALGICLLVYCAATAISYVGSVRHFERQDL